jgi:hypothetical protein
LDRQTLRLLFVIAAFLLAGTYLFVLSEGGMLERIRLKQEIRAAIEGNGIIKSENDAFKDSNGGERTPTHEDMINSGYVKTGDKILIIRDTVGQQATRRVPETPEIDSALTVYRILWVIVTLSVFSVLYYFWRRSSADEA